MPQRPTCWVVFCQNPTVCVQSKQVQGIESRRRGMFLHLGCHPRGPLARAPKPPAAQPHGPRLGSDPRPWWKSRSTDFAWHFSLNTQGSFCLCLDVYSWVSPGHRWRGPRRHRSGGVLRVKHGPACCHFLMGRNTRNSRGVVAEQTEVCMLGLIWGAGMKLCFCSCASGCRQFQSLFPGLCLWLVGLCGAGLGCVSSKPES